MKRIPMILVLLTALLLFSSVGGSTAALARTGDQAVDRVDRVPVAAPGIDSNSTSPGGDHLEGDPDSMGDGLSREFNCPVSTNATYSEVKPTVGGTSIDAYLRFILLQVQVLLP